MFVLEISNSYPEGKYLINDIFCKDQSLALADAGVSVVIVAIDLRSIRRWRKWGLNIIKNDNITVYHYNFPLGKNSRIILSSIGFLIFKYIFKIVLKNHGRPDIMHAHFAEYAGIYALKSKIKYNIPYFITEHSSSFNKFTLEKKQKFFFNDVYRESSMNIAVSPSLKKNLENNFPYAFNFIPNIIDEIFFRIKKRSLAGDKFVITSVGSLYCIKGMDILIKAFTIAFKSVENVFLNIIGDGPQKKLLTNLTRDLGVNDKIKFYGILNREKIAEIFTDSDCFALSSRKETFGVAYAEAMAAGLPVVATKCGGPEFMINHENGILAENENEYSFSEALIKMKRDISNYSSKIISDYARKNFSGKTVAEKLIMSFKKFI